MMTRSYTEDEWLGVEPFYSPAVREEHDPFDWDAYEKRQREEEAALWLERSRHTIFPHLPCSVCGALTIHILMTRDDNPTLEQDIARASATVKCWRHA